MRGGAISGLSALLAVVRLRWCINARALLWRPPHCSARQRALPSLQLGHRNLYAPGTEEG